MFLLLNQGDQNVQTRGRGSTGAGVTARSAAGAWLVSLVEILFIMRVLRWIGARSPMAGSPVAATTKRTTAPAGKPLKALAKRSFSPNGKEGEILPPPAPPRTSGNVTIYTRP
jgi:hypothetical protein